MRCKVKSTQWWGMVTTMVALTSAMAAQPLNRPWVGAVFFYWYEWDEDAEWGNWLGAVHNTPLFGYYDNRKLSDNFRSLLLAADWGMTHFFLDYWGHDWRGENNEPRETTVLKAAEKVRSLGYPIFIGYYQDGTNFAMRDFWRNMSERRDTYRWLRDYARSPAWTWLFGKPFQMVYARNGLPEVTMDRDGFQAWLRQRYGSIDKLNAEWGTSFRDFSDIRMDFNAIGFQRAMSIAYQFERWQQDWAKLEQLVHQEFGLPGLRASFDAAYAPFRGFGFERFARTFGGPHSYGGIFGQPHEQDAERFLQTAVAKKCGTIFFDHLKHRYFDWNIRVPGGAYPPEPHHYDRFWVGNLMRFVDGVLHLSWNEWWEGSNLEPSMEGGKRFCETNLLYSTIWQLSHTPHSAPHTLRKIGLLVNDWIFEHGGGDASDLSNAVQGLRAVNAPFDIVLQSEATSETLRRFRVIVAPAGGVGFGFNAKGERIEQVLQTWLQSGDRLLITSQGGTQNIGRSAGRHSAVRHSSLTTRHSPFNFFADIGVAGDEAVSVQGFSHREDWGKLPEGAFGAGSQATVRWTPSEGNTTVLMLPTPFAASARQEPRPPIGDLLLRWHGNAIWRNRLRLFVNEQFIGEVTIEPGWRVYEVRLPAQVIGTAQAMEVRWEFAELHIPGEKEPQRFKGEWRVCNLALDWVQVCTPDMPFGERKSFAWQPMETAQFAKPLSGSFRAPLRRRRTFLPEGKPLSTYNDGITRDLLISVNSSLIPHPSSLLLVNGIFTDDPRWWATMLERVSKVPCGKFAQLTDGSLPDRPELMSAVLTAGTTKFLLMENRSGQTRKLRLLVPPEPDLPVAEILVLSHDGKRFVPRPSSPVPFLDTVRFYAAYQIVFAPVKLTTPQWVAFPGQRTQLPLTVRNLMDEPITPTLQIGSVIASIKGEPVRVSLQPKERRQIALPVEVKPFADWGVKTTFVKVTWGKGDREKETAFFLRPLIVGRNADVRCLTAAVTSHTPTVALVNAPTTPYGDLNWWHPAKDVPGETAKDVEIVVTDFPSAGKPLTLKVGNLKDGEQKQVRLPLPFYQSPIANRHSLCLRWRDSAGTHERTQPLSVTLLPEQLPKTQPDQVATMVVADADAAQGVPLSVIVPQADSLRQTNFVVRLPDGTTLPTHVADGRVHFIVPPPKPLWRMNIGTEGDEKVLVRGFSHRETWASGVTIRWLPGEGRDTVLRIPRPTVAAPAYRLQLHGQALWGNRVTVYAGGQKVADLDIRSGWQTLTVPLPATVWQATDEAEVPLVFHHAHVPAEKLTGSADKRVCNFALDWVALESAADGQAMLLALCRANNPHLSSLIPHPFSVQAQDGVVRIDNGLLELEWREDAGGTLTKFVSKRTGRDYAAQSCGAGIGTFGQFDPNRPATNTAQFVVDDFVWQRNGKAKVRVIEQNPVWVTVETTASVQGSVGASEKGFKAVQRYRIFAGVPLMELTVVVEPRPSSLVPRPDELVVMEGRFNARWWTKSFPNFVGLGDKPPKVHGQNIVHFGWRVGDWVPPMLCLFNPNDLTETLSLLVAENQSARQEPRPPSSENDGANLVRQGFWGEPRGKPTAERRYATIELIAKPPRLVRLRLWLWLHEGHHLAARQHRTKLLQPLPIAIAP